MESLDEAIGKTVDLHIPDRTVLEARDRGEWLRRLVEVALDGNKKVFFRISVYTGEPGLPVQRILAVDDSCTIFRHRYVVEEHVGGTRLGIPLDQASNPEAKEIFRPSAGYSAESIPSTGSGQDSGLMATRKRWLALPTITCSA